MRTNLVLAVLAVILGAISAWEIYRDRTTFTEYEKVPRLFEGFLPENVNAVVLSKPEAEKEGEKESEASKDAKGKDGESEKQPERQQIMFVRSDDRWVLGGETELAGVPVTGYRIQDDILAHVQRIRRDKKAVLKVDADEETLRKYDLTEDRGLLIQCFDASQRPIAELILGRETTEKYGEEFVRGYLVRRRDAKDIILYEPPPPGYWTLGVDQNEWIDSKVWEVKLEDIQRISLRNPKGKWACEKKDGKWVGVEKPDGVGAVRQSEVDAVANRLCYMSHDGYQGPLAKYSDLASLGLDPAVYEVSIKLQDGKVYTVWIGKKIAGEQYHHARFSLDPYSHFLMKVGDWIAAGFDRDPKDFFDPRAEVIAPQSGKGGKEGAEHGKEIEKAGAGKEAGGAANGEGVKEADAGKGAKGGAEHGKEVEKAGAGKEAGGAGNGKGPGGGGGGKEAGNGGEPKDKGPPDKGSEASGGNEREEAARARQGVLFPGLRREAVATVVLEEIDQRSGARRSITFRRTPQGRWVLGGGHPLAGAQVSADRIEKDILAQLEGMRSDDWRMLMPHASQPALEAAGLTERTGLTIVCKDAQGRELARVVVGKRIESELPEEIRRALGNRTGPGRLVRSPSSDHVVLYVPPGPARWRVGLEPTEWIDPRVWSVDLNRIVGLRLRNPAGEVSFRREKDRWVAETEPEGVGPVRQRQVEAMASRMSYMGHDGYLRPLAGAPDPESLGLDPALYEAAIRLQGGDVLGVRIGRRIPGDESFHYAVFTAEPTRNFLMKVGEWVVAGFARDPHEYFERLGPVVGSSSGKQKKPPGTEEAPERAAPPTSRPAGHGGKIKGKGRSEVPRRLRP